VCRKPGYIDVFARGANGELVTISYTQEGGWGPWISLGGGIVGSPDACAWDGNRIDVFARGSNDALYQITWTGTWGGWANKGGTLYSDPGAASLGYGYLDVFIQGAGNTLYTLSYDPWTWGSWTYLADGVAGSPDACSWSNDAGRHQP